MKTIKTTIIGAIFMFASIVNYANTNFNDDFSAEKVTIVFNNAKTGHELTIRSNDGIILHTETVKRNGNLVKLFDFSKLENGNYTLELEKDFEIEIKSIKIENNIVTFNNEVEKIIFKPVVRNVENRLLISKLAFDKEPLMVSVYFKDELIYSETVKGDNVLNRVYKLDETAKGEYRVVMYNNGRSFINEFKL